MEVEERQGPAEWQRECVLPISVSAGVKEGLGEDHVATVPYNRQGDQETRRDK